MRPSRMLTATALMFVIVSAMYAQEAASRQAEAARALAIPREMTLDLGACHVTRGQFAQFIAECNYRTTPENAAKDTPSDWSKMTIRVFAGKEAGRCWKDPGFAQTDDHPVVRVSKYDVNDFCDWKSRVIRGGSWYSNPFYCRLADRYYLPAVMSRSDVGFRVICTDVDRPGAATPPAAKPNTGASTR